MHKSIYCRYNAIRINQLQNLLSFSLVASLALSTGSVLMSFSPNSWPSTRPPAATRSNAWKRRNEIFGHSFHQYHRQEYCHQFHEHCHQCQDYRHRCQYQYFLYQPGHHPWHSAQRYHHVGRCSRSTMQRFMVIGPMGPYVFPSP